MNKVILVTGAAKRIGKQIAKEFFAIDFNIIVHFNSSSEDAISLCNELNAICLLYTSPSPRDRG